MNQFRLAQYSLRAHFHLFHFHTFMNRRESEGQCFVFKYGGKILKHICPYDVTDFVVVFLFYFLLLLLFLKPYWLKWIF